DLVIVDLYPFEETLAQTNDEKLIIEKIDIGGPSMIRAAAKNYKDVLVVAAKNDYAELENILKKSEGNITLEQRRSFAAKAFEIVAHYDVAIAKYFSSHQSMYFFESVPGQKAMRYGENPHQSGNFFGNLNELFVQLNGKELSYNNLVDVDAAMQLIREFNQPQMKNNNVVFAIIKHTNVCGVAERASIAESWKAALAGDPESAFGGVLITNKTIDKTTAELINEIFFEVLIAPAFDADALAVLRSKKNRILLKSNKNLQNINQYRTLLSGVLEQEMYEGNYDSWNESGGRETPAEEKEDLVYANLICKHLKSNAIALVKNK